MATPSRYRNATLVANGENLYYAARATLDATKRSDDRYVDVRLGDTIHSVSHRELGDMRLWWVVADFNDITDPFADLAVGTTLRVPSITRLWMEILK